MLSGDHGLGDHGLGDHGLGDHGLGDHSLIDHSLGDHSLGDHSLGDHSLGDHSLYLTREKHIQVKLFGELRSINPTNPFVPVNPGVGGALKAQFGVL